MDNETQNLNEEHCKIRRKYHPYEIECPCGLIYGSGSRKIFINCSCGRQLDVLIHSTEERGFNVVRMRKPETKQEIKKENENDSSKDS